MIKNHPYLTLNNTKDALKYYEEVLGATNISRMEVHADQAEQFGVSLEVAADMTMHSQFDVLGTTVMAADNFQKEKLYYNGISILIDLNSEDKQSMKEAQEFWEKLAKSKKVTINMPFEEQFWGGVMGDFTDKYGVRWMLHAQPYSKIM
ncbi:VOC family protein [Lactococcus garvieae]